MFDDYEKVGKWQSNLMNIIGFLDKLSDGSYNFDGKNASTLSENQKSDLRNEYLGFIFQ